MVFKRLKTIFGQIQIYKPADRDTERIYVVHVNVNNVTCLGRYCINSFIEIRKANGVYRRSSLTSWYITKILSKKDLVKFSNRNGKVIRTYINMIPRIKLATGGYERVMYENNWGFVDYFGTTNNLRYALIKVLKCLFSTHVNKLEELIKLLKIENAFSIFTEQS